MPFAFPLSYIAFSIVALVVAELNYGAKVSSKTKENLKRLNRLLEIIRVVPFDIECAKAFGTIKSRLRSISRPTGEMDALIAAIAIANNASFLQKSVSYPSTGSG